MKVLSQTVLAVALLVAGGFFAASVSATTIRSASGYGPGLNSDPSATFASCSDPLNTNPCEAFNLVSQGTVTLDGVINFSVYQFASNSNGTENPVFDVFNLGSIAPGQTLFLTSSLFSVLDLANAQIFSCANGSSAPTDSLGAPVNGPCSPGLGFSGDYAALVANGVVNGSASFTTTADFNLTALVLEVPVQPVATPEPASLTLLGTGLAILAGSKLRRRKRA